VELERLTGREPQGLLAMGAGQLVDLEPLCRSADSAWKADTRHELKSRLELLPSTLVT
jgi:hypothetical protein